MNKANTPDKETSFLDLNIKVIGSDIHTSVYDKRDDFGFPIVNFSWLSGDVPRLPSYGIYISQLVRFARCCTSVLDFHSKNLQITSKLLTQGYRYHKLRKTFGKFFRSYSELLSKFGDISFQEYLSKGISHPVFYGDLVYKLRRVKDTPNSILSGSKIVKRLRRRQYDPVIIERTKGLMIGPIQGDNLKLNHDSGSQFNVELRPGVLLQRGIKTRDHNSTWNYQSGSHFNVES